MCAKNRARTRRSCKTRAGTSRSPSAALPARESCPPWSDRRGPRCAHRLPPRLNRRQNERGGSARRGGSTAGLGSRSCVALGRAAWPPAARNRGLAPRDRGGEPAGQERAARPAPLRCAPLERLHGRRGCTPACAGFRCAAPTVPACALLEHPRANNSAALRVACRSLPYASRSPFRSFVAALRARAAARCARLLRGLAPRAQTSR